MAKTWYIVHADKEDGPFTGPQLVEMAETGKLLPTDLVRRSDVEVIRPSSAIRGLYSDANLTLPLANSKSSIKPNKSYLWNRKLLISAVIVFCFPVSLVIIWRNEVLNRNQKMFSTGVAITVFSLPGLIIAYFILFS